MAVVLPMTRFNAVVFQLLLFNSLCFNYSLLFRLQCFDAVGWAAGRASGL